MEESQTPSASTPRGSPRDPIWVSDAGLALLGVYLPRLFERLDLVRERSFVDEAARERAIHCLDFLVRGDTRSPDAGLVLAKIICVWPLAQPVRPSAGLDEATRNVLEELLRAVIAHWSVLGKTSVDGLRESFLKRDGRLTRREDDAEGGWNLRVEPRSFDLLLDRLPWTFSPLRSPWMEKAVTVDWR